MKSLEDESCAPYLKDGVWHSPFTSRPICRTPRTHPAAPLITTDYTGDAR